MGAYFLRQSVFASVAHRYWNPHWDEVTNRQVYGADASSEGIGSNLRLEACAIGTDGMSDDEQLSEELLTPGLEQIKQLVDHQCLFAEDSEFTLSTLENITVHLGNCLQRTALRLGHWHALTVWETEHLWCRYFPAHSDLVEIGFRLHNVSATWRGPIHLESGLALAREASRRTLAEVLERIPQGSPPAELWRAVQRSPQALCRLRIDLGRHEYILMGSDS
jgi:hypothetical protein